MEKFQFELIFDEEDFEGFEKEGEGYSYFSSIKMFCVIDLENRDFLGEIDIDIVIEDKFFVDI